MRTDDFKHFTIATHKTCCATALLLCFETLFLAPAHAQCWIGQETSPVRVVSNYSRVEDLKKEHALISMDPNLLASSSFSFEVKSGFFAKSQEIKTRKPIPAQAIRVEKDLPNAAVDIGALLKAIQPINDKDKARLVLYLPWDPPKKGGIWNDRLEKKETAYFINFELFKYPDVNIENSKITMLELKPEGSLANGAQTELTRTRDALVTINSKSNKGHWQTCVGTHVGDGKILTARHCLGTLNYVLFGQTKLGNLPSNPSYEPEYVSDLLCSATDSGTLSQSDSSNLRLDAAILQTHLDFSITTQPGADKFRAATIAYERRELAPDDFQLATIWPNSLEYDIAFDENGEPTRPKPFQKYLFKPQTRGLGVGNFYSCQRQHSSNALLFCAGKDTDLSPMGWPNGCPTNQGASGSPLFDARDQTPTVIAVASIDADTNSNCAAPVWFE